MRIPSANIPVQTVNSNTSANAQKAVESIDRHSGRVADSYAKNAQPQIIDAEFVEIYSPGSKGPSRERFDLDLSVEPEASSAPVLPSATPPKLNRYQQLSAETTPRPGSFIDIFA